MPEIPPPVRAWHAFAESRDPALLDDLLADDVVFRSPAVFTPQEGKALTSAYLHAAMAVLGPTLRYVHEWYDESSAVLEFEGDLDGIFLQGVDMLGWNDEGRLTSFTVLIRPLKGLQQVIPRMAAELAALQR